jgi:signal transduction histidine kinase
MIRKLRLKFIAITSAALLLLLLTLFLLINIFMNYRSNEQVEHFLYDLIQNDGVFYDRTPPLNNSHSSREEPPIRIKGFSAKLGTGGEILSLFWDEMLFSEEEVTGFAKDAYNTQTDSGKIESYKYKKTEKDYGVLIVFADQSVQDHMLIELLNLSYITGSIGFLILFIITIFLSKLIVQPISIAFEKQKEFVTDSGHELKTPLSIISANNEILEMEFGRNKYSDAIRQQIKRMNLLTKDLLSLAKTENNDQKENFISFNFSALLEKTALSFESLAFEERKKIVLEIEKDVLFRGDEQKIKKMIEALIDNAVKYAEPDSEIKVQLSKKGNKKILLIQNAFYGKLPKDKSKLFDRFYRADESRSSEIAGYGIGLSIVKNISEMHGGKISVVHCLKEEIVFKIIF